MRNNQVLLTSRRRDLTLFSYIILSLSQNVQSKTVIVLIVDLQLYSTLCKMQYIGETGKRLEDNHRDTSETVFKHSIFAKNMIFSGISLHQGSTESRKYSEQKFLFQLGSFAPHGINELISLNDGNYLCIFWYHGSPNNASACSRAVFNWVS